MVNTELEMAHLFGLSESANAKIVAKKKLQEIPTGSLLKGVHFLIKLFCLSGMEDLTLD